MTGTLGKDFGLYIRCFTAKPYNQAANYQTWRISGSRQDAELVAFAAQLAEATMGRSGALATGGQFIRVAVGYGPLDPTQLTSNNVEILFDTESV